MKRLLILTGLILALNSFGQQNSLDKRSQVWQNMVALQPPYTFHIAVVCTSATYIVPDSLIVCSMRNKNAGTIYVSTPYSDSVPVYSTDYDIFMYRITKVHAGGTSDTCQINSISLDGVKKSGN